MPFLKSLLLLLTLSVGFPSLRLEFGGFETSRRNMSLGPGGVASPAAESPRLSLDDGHEEREAGGASSPCVPGNCVAHSDNDQTVQEWQAQARVLFV